MVKRVGKRGDTLIEVMLAVGIFSMVAVAVVSVMSGGTSSAQTALEATLAREEIDTQAEALRFIQSSYISEKDTEDGKFAKLWKLITASEYGNSNNVNVITGENGIKEIANYSPKECSALYGDDGEAKKYGFVINTRALGDSPYTAIISAKNPDDAGKFRQASTYPRLIYSDDNSSLTSSSFESDLQAAEGIYIIAVKDPNTTNITNTKKSAYYDFYIRTCWYGTGDQTPSTISTVMRLYDPGIVKDE